MGKKNKKLSRTSRRTKKSSSTPKGEIVYQGKCVFQISTASGSYTAAVTLQALLTTLDPILMSMSKCFQLYRYESLTVSLLPTGTCALGYVNALADGAPTTYLQVANLPNSTFTVSQQTVPSRFTVSPQFLLGESPNKFWKTYVSSASTPAWDDVQGVFYIGFTNSSGATSDVSLTYRVRLADAVQDNMTPSPAFSRVSPVERFSWNNCSDALITTAHGRFQCGVRESSTSDVGVDLSTKAAEDHVLFNSSVSPHSNVPLKPTNVSGLCSCCWGHSKSLPSE